jgi:uncharacterized delta-60 repeat protein
MRSLNALRKGRWSDCRFIEALEDRRLLSAGSPIIKFGSSGSVLLPQLDHVQQAAAAPDGKIVLFGSLGGTLELLRLTAAGAVDANFGAAGVVALPGQNTQNPGLLDVTTIAIQSDNKIVLAGDNGQEQFAVERLNADGSIDNSFGAGGVATVPLPSSEATDLLIQADGKIVASGEGGTNPTGGRGFVVARFNLDGTPDASFNNSGVLVTPLVVVNPLQGVIALDDQGRLLAGGIATDLPNKTDAAVVDRFNTDGSPDLSFNGSGSSSQDVSTGFLAQRLLQLIPHADGSIAVFGATQNEIETLRIAPGGAFDSTLGINGGGTVLSPPLGKVSAASADANGYLLYANGGSDIGRDRPFGTPDLSFGSSGQANAAPPNAVISAVAAMPDETVITAAISNRQCLVMRLDDSHKAVSPPVANTQGPYTVLEHQQVKLLGGMPSDGSIIEYQWDLNYDGQTFSPDAAGHAVTFDATSLNGPQTRTIALRVLDAYGATSPIATTTVTVVHIPPQVTITGNPTAVQGEPYTLNLSAFGEPSPQPIQSWTINWGDGTSDTLPGNPTTATHVFQNAPASDTITATVNEAGASFAANDLSLDNSFGSRGVAVRSVPGFGNLVGAASLPDGGVLLLGLFSSPQVPTTAALERLNADGSLDTTFGQGGIAPIIAPPGSPAPYINPFLLRVQPDGKYLVVVDLSLVRLNTDGTFDKSFGTVGIIDIPSVTGFSGASDITFTADGKIVLMSDVGAVIVARLNPDGSRDTTFTPANLSLSPVIIRPAHGLYVFNDGSILAPVYTPQTQSFSIVAYKLHADGSLDQSFGLAGRAGILGTLGGGDQPAGMTVLPNGKFLVSGPGGGDGQPMTVARFLANGTLDTTFGVNGRFSFPTQLVPEATLQRILPQPDGSALIVFSTNQLEVARITPDGQLDTSVGNGGLVSPALDPGGPVVNLSTRPLAAMLDPQGRLVVVANQANSTGQPEKLFISRFLVQPPTVQVLPGRRPPVVNIGGVPDTTVEGSAFEFTSSVNITSAADASKTSYAWSVAKDGAPIDLGAPSNGVSFVFNPPDNGSYVVTLTVTDSLGDSASASQSVTVLNAAPSASFSVDGPITAGHTSIARFTNVFDAPADLAAGFTYSYDFNNDGKFEITSSSSPTATIPAKYLTSGSHKIHGRITDKDGGFTDYVVGINVLPASPARFSISGVVFLDRNKNRRQEKTEKDLTGVQLYIDTNHNGKLDTGEMTVKSNAAGRFTFSGLAAGNYRVRAVLPKGRNIELPKGGFLDVMLGAGRSSVGNILATT